jgi:hypothetical protein
MAQTGASNADIAFTMNEDASTVKKWTWGIRYGKRSGGGRGPVGDAGDKRKSLRPISDIDETEGGERTGLPEVPGAEGAPVCGPEGYEAAAEYAEFDGGGAFEGDTEGGCVGLSPADAEWIKNFEDLEALKMGEIGRKIG